MSLQISYTRIFKESYANPFIFAAHEQSKECFPLCSEDTSRSLESEGLPVKSGTSKQPIEKPDHTETEAEKPPSLSPSSTPAEIPQEAPSNISTIKCMKILSTWKRLSIERYLELPKIVLAGPEQCGKSSIAESLTGFPVQYTSELQTRFPIELTIYDDPTMAYSRATIILDPKCDDLSANGLSDVEKFNASHARFLLATKGAFERLLVKVSEILAMTAPKAQSSVTNDELKTDTAQNSTGKISSHMLCLEMRGPQGANFSFIDTPGVPRVNVSEGSESKSDQASKLVASLINQKRKIIAATFEVNITKSRHKVFNWIKDADPTAERTIGVMTKCDLLAHDGLEIIGKGLFSDLSENSTIPAYGLYAVRNKTLLEKAGLVSLEGVREHEAALFRGHEWQTVTSDVPIQLGVHQLCRGLDKIYAEHVRTHYPLVISEIKRVLSQRRLQLGVFGTRQRTIGEQRRYLAVVLRNFGSTMQRCLSDERSIPMLDQLHSRLNEQIDAREMAFRERFFTEGGKFQFQTASSEVDPFLEEGAEYFAVPDGKPSNLYTWIDDKYQSKKATALPGLIPDGLIQALFEEQTAKWPNYTEEFLNDAETILLNIVECVFKITCYDQTILPQLTKSILKKVKMDIEAWRRLCNSMLRRQRDTIQIVLRRSDCTKQINAARTTRFLNAIARIKEEEPVIKVRAKPIFGPLLNPRKENEPPLTPPSSIGNASPKTPPSARWHNIFNNPALNTPLSTRARDDFFISPNPISSTNSEWIFNIPDRTKIFQRQYGNETPRHDPQKRSRATGSDNFAEAKEIITHDREIVYQIHDILKACYTSSLQSYTQDICDTLNKSTIREMLEGSSRVVVEDLSDEDVKGMFQETEMNRRARKGLEEDIMRLELALLEGEAVVQERVAE